jgi:hypothetical protein
MEENTQIILGNGVRIMNNEDDETLQFNLNLDEMMDEDG